MAFKINIEGLRSKLQEQSSAKQKKVSKIGESLVKATEPGDYSFRAYPYPHSKDPSTEPYAAKFYHTNLPDGTFTFYCPKKNDGKDCAICSYAFENLKKHKGTPLVHQFRDLLPEMHVFLAGRFNSEPAPKLFKINSYSGEPGKLGKNHQKVIDWFCDADEEIYTWMDPMKGRDIKLKYKKFDDAKRTNDRFKNAKTELIDFSLSMKRTPMFKTIEEYESFIAQTPNVDELFPKKTSEEALALLERWNSKNKAETPETTSVVAKPAPMKKEAPAGAVVSTKTPAMPDDLDALAADLEALGYTTE